jgi:UMP-CMP kinase
MLERVMERGKTSGRSDDNIESLRKRFATFLAETMPVVDNVRAIAPSLVHTINSARPLDDVFESTRSLLTPLVTDEVEPDGLVAKQVTHAACH